MRLIVIPAATGIQMYENVKCQSLNVKTKVQMSKVKIKE